MKVIFLDIDGVLNVIPQGYDRYGAIFHQHFVDNLKELVDKTGAKIVVSSSWRLAKTVEWFKEMWMYRKLPGEVVDITPDLAFKRKDLSFDYWQSVPRGSEIDRWLKEHIEVTNYVILDDDSDMLVKQFDHFVCCSGNASHPDHIDGGGYGLTKQCTQKAIEILNKNK